uniref:SECA_MOTOR_DEAD domain-containing protein n=1 Tax=Globodera pallida TaxID=36090 RepID=A0A183CBG7_GLOPA
MDSLKEAVKMNENCEYVIREGAVVPIDYQNTGTQQRSTSLSDGLHQFLQLKHGLRMDPETLVTSFITNPGFINRYKQIYGLSGTLGSNYEHSFLKEHYNRKRAALVICLTNDKVKQISDAVKSEFPDINIYKYTDDDEQLPTEFVGPMDVIFSTNYAGRGTDIKTNAELEANGGLHVIVTFMPYSRVERQAFGRTARQGKKGTAQLILPEFDLDKDLIDQEKDQQSQLETLEPISETDQHSWISKICESEWERFWSDSADECSSPPVALQLDGGPPPPPSTQRFYSNQLTLSYSNDPRGNGKDGGHHRHFWQQKQRMRRGLEVIDFETDKIPSSKTKSAEKLNEVNGGKNKTVQKEKQKLSSGGIQLDDDDEIRKIGKNFGNGSAKTAPSSAECPTNYASLLDFLDLHSLAQAFIELDFLDSSASSDFFAVGLSGNVFMRSPPPITTTHVGGGGVMHDIVQLGAARSKNVPDEEDKSLLRDADELEEDQQQRDNNNNRREMPPMLRFPGVGPIGYQRKTLEMIFSDLSANLALLQAFRTKLLKVRLGPNSSVFGQMLRTTCGLDEVCLSDSIPEMGEKYPDQQLEVEIEPVESPFIKFSKDLATLNIVGTATFLLSQNGQTIGRIPFSATVELGVRHIRTTNASSSSTGSNSTLAHNKMDVSLAIPRLDLRDDMIDFFGLPSSTLDGFLNTVRNAILNSAGRALSPGISLMGLERRLCPYGISQPGIQLLDNGLVLLDAELDAYVLLFDSGEPKLCSLAEL